MSASKSIGHWIGGKTVPSASGRHGAVWNPATGEAAANVDFADARAVDLAVERAQAAFPEWRATPLSRRAEIMFRFRELVDANRREIAALITFEHGKTHADAMGEVARGIENIEFACGIPHLLKGGFSEQVSHGVDVFQIHQPLGVVAGITPFNFPAMVPLWMFPNAIACGNTFILKPSEKDPSASMLLAELLQKAGVPDGVFNVVQGDRVAVDRLLDHPCGKSHQFRRVHAGRQNHLRNRHPQRQARPGPGRREEPHGYPARCRYRDGGRCRGFSRFRFGGRTLHGDLGGHRRQ